MGNEESSGQSEHMGCIDIEFEEVNFTHIDVSSATSAEGRMEDVGGGNILEKECNRKPGYDVDRCVTSQVQLQDHGSEIIMTSQSNKTMVKLRHESTKPAQIRTIIANPKNNNLFSTKPIKNDVDQLKSSQNSPVGSSTEFKLKSPEKYGRFVASTPAQRKSEIFPAPPLFEELSGLDLSHLNPEERAAILQVAARAKQIEQVETQKVRKMQKQVQTLSINNKVDSQEVRKNNSESITSAIRRRSISDNSCVAARDDAKTNSSKQDDQEKGSVHRFPHKENKVKEICGKKTTVNEENLNCEKIAKSKVCSFMQSAFCSLCNEPITERSQHKIEAANSLKEVGDAGCFKCSSCSKLSCKSCCVSSILAKKGEVLCKFCLKQRELAARSNVWLKRHPSSHLHRSNSVDIPKSKLRHLNKTEDSTNERKSIRRRSFSADSSNFLSDDSTDNSTTTSDSRENDVQETRVKKMSISEALIRRLSIDKLVQNELRKAMKEEETNKVEEKVVMKEQSLSSRRKCDQTNITPKKNKEFNFEHNHKQNYANKTYPSHEVTSQENEAKGGRSPVPYLSELKQKFSIRKQFDASEESINNLRDISSPGNSVAGSSEEINLENQQKMKETKLKSTNKNVEIQIDNNNLEKQQFLSEEFISTNEKPSMGFEVQMTSANLQNENDAMELPTNEMTSSEAMIGPLVTSRSRRSSIEDERRTDQTSNSSVSEGPAEWSVDELDDIDTFFLVTSSGADSKSLASAGMTTPSALRSISSQPMDKSLISSPANSFQVMENHDVIDDENDTEGDFDELFGDAEDKDSFYCGGWKRVAPLTDLSNVISMNVNDSNQSESSTVYVIHEKPMASHSTEIDARLIHHNQVTDDNSVGKDQELYSTAPNEDDVIMMPGESFFKKTSCEIDREIDFIKDGSYKPKTNARETSTKLNDILHKEEIKPVNSDQEIHNRPIPAKRSHSIATKVPQITISDHNETTHDATANIRNIEQPIKIDSASKDKPKSSHYDGGTKSKKVEDSLSKTSGRSPYVNKFGSKVLQAPSSSKLPISPLAMPSGKHEQKKTENDLNGSESKPYQQACTIWAVHGGSYFDSDSGSNSDLEEEQNMLEATSSVPIYPEDMEEYDSSFATTEDVQKSPSLFFRRTASTDNFEELLMKTTETPRPRRFKPSGPTSSVKRTTSFYAESQSDRDKGAMWGRSVSLSPPNKNKEETENRMSEAERRKSEPSIFVDVPKRPDNNARSPSKSKILENIQKSTERKISTSTEDERIIDKKETVVTLSSHSSKMSDSTSSCDVSRGLHNGGMTRCVSCGILSNPDEANVERIMTSSADSITTTSVQLNPPTSLFCEKSPSRNVKSVNSSTQVTPEKESAPGVASIDLCQLTALIEALRGARDIVIPERKEQNETIKNNRSDCAAYTHISNEIQSQSNTLRFSPVTHEPRSNNVSLKNEISLIDASTVTCLTEDPIILPQDRIVSCGRFIRSGNHDDGQNRLRHRRGKIDRCVGTNDSMKQFGEPCNDYLPNYYTRNVESPNYNYRHNYERCTIGNYDRDYDDAMMHYGRKRFPEGDPEFNICENFPMKFQRRTEVYNKSPHYPCTQMHYGYEPRDYDAERRNYYPVAPLFRHNHPSYRFGRQNYSSNYRRMTSYDEPDQILFNENLRDIYEDDVTSYERDKAINKDVIRETRHHAENREIVDLLPNNNFNLRRSASVPTVARSNLTRSESRLNYQETQQMNNLATNPSTLGVLVGCNQYATSRNETNQTSNNASAKYEESRQINETEPSYSTTPSSGTSVSSTAYHLSSAEASMQNHQSGTTNDDKFTPPSGQSKLNQPQSTRTSRDLNHVIGSGSQINRQLPQPPEVDEYRWRYNNNKRYNSLSSHHNRSIYTADRGEASVERGVNRLRQTMEDLDQEEKELDMRLRYLELGRQSKTGSMASIPTSNGNPIHSLIDVDSSGFPFDSSQNNTTVRDDVKPTKIQIDYDRSNADERQQRNYVIVNDVAQIIPHNNRETNNVISGESEQDVIRSRLTNQLRHYHNYDVHDNTRKDDRQKSHDRRDDNAVNYDDGGRNNEHIVRSSRSRENHHHVQRSHHRSSNQCGNPPRRDNAPRKGQTPQTNKFYYTNFAIQNPRDHHAPWHNMKDDHVNAMTNSKARKSSDADKYFYVDNDEEISRNTTQYEAHDDETLGNIYERMGRNERCEEAKYLMQSSNVVKSRSRDVGNSTRLRHDPCSNGRRKAGQEGKMALEVEGKQRSVDQRNVVSDTEEYHLRKEMNDWFDKPTEVEESSTYADFTKY